MKPNRFIHSLLILATFAKPLMAAPSVEETKAIAKEAYIYGVPLVDTWKTMYVFNIAEGNPQYKGPFNGINNFARVFTPEDTSFVTPNSDTPYTFIGLDLRAEPMVITIPPIEKDRYFVFQLMDLYTFNFAYIGSRVTGNEGGDFMITPTGWKGEKPPGIKQVIPCETLLVTVVGRTQLFNPADLENVKKIQAGYKVRPLSTYLGKPAPPQPVAIKWHKPLPPAEERTSPEFFDLLAFLLQFAEPPHTTETELRARFASIGIIAGKPLDIAALSPEIRDALKQGMIDGQKEIDARRRQQAGDTGNLFGTREFLKNDFVARATGTQVGIGANSRDEALYPMYDKDADGEALDGSKHRYTLRFAKGEMPPVQAFWSLTMYHLPSQLLVKNTIDRYLINSPMLPGLKTDADGGLTIYVQEDSPGTDKESNWLPAPKGPFMIALRCYWPKAALLEGQWQKPPLKKAN